MYMYDLIMKKRDGGKLSESQIRQMVEEYVAGNIPDYQMSAMLMAIYFRGMDEEETYVLTDAMAHSGDMVDLSGIEGIKVDKHSTGGVGDKTTLIISPIVASLGVKVAKMSGRGLGHTGGTIDKMESIPNMRVELTQKEFFDVVNKAGFSIIGQSGNITPCDKKLYALRDVTATVDAIPLIASSIMSKKLAAGSNCILLDVKTGSGAFMKTLDDSIALSKAMVDIGERAGRKTMAMITDMDIPLGNNIGNSLEVIEAVNVLNGNGAQDLTNVCIELASNMLYLAGKGTVEECKKMVQDTIKNKTAVKYLKKMVELQGGDSSVIEDTNNFEKSSIMYELI
ncbi:MAG: thymidine phosphorylase, partial [Peptostreptococcaceae bacterium]|nr:thymidine phosphorylase [Peptostreptococcaceae bacterium]